MELEMPKRMTHEQRRAFLKEWRKKKELTLTEAAPLAGMSVAALSTLERGEKNYTQGHIVALAQAYGIRPVDLLFVNPIEDVSLSPKLRDLDDKLSLWALWKAAPAADRKEMAEKLFSAVA
jgi:transcriptional regulator with XRE-family HTH domain